VLGRAVAALLSVLVLATTGYAWVTLRGLGGLSEEDVLGGGLSAPDGATDVLLVGNDSRTDAQGNPLPKQVLRELHTTMESGNLTDSMILVRIPNGGQRASAMSFPRDTRVDLGHGYGRHLLTEAYNTERTTVLRRLEQQGVADPAERERRARAAGQKFLIETVEELSGVTVDHYAEVNLLGFYEVTKAVGGVEVCLKEPVNDKQYSGAVFPAGRQRLSGGDALAFVRQRHGLLHGDLDRVRRQQAFLSGLAREVLSAGTLANPVKLNDLVQAVSRTVVLDRGWDLLEFAQQVQGIAGGAVEFQTIPVQLVGESGSERVVADEAQVRRFAADLLLPPQQRPVRHQADRQPAPEPAPETPQPSEITVHIYNGVGTSGLAGSVRSRLAAKGFDTGETGNTESLSSSVVKVAPGETGAGEQVAEALGGLPVRESSSVSPGSAQVYLGGDYEGPGVQNFAGAPAVRLDGAARAQSPRQPAPITADGVPCVY